MHKQRLTLGVLFVFASEVTTRVASVVIFILISHTLGLHGTGVYSIGTTLLFLGSRLSFWGLDQILVRDVAREHGLAGKYISNFLLLRMLLSSIAGGILLLLLWTVLPYAPESRWPLSVLVWGLLPENIVDICRAVFLARERTQYVFFVNCMTMLARICGALVVASNGYGVIGFAWAMSGGGLLGAVCAIACLWWRFAIDWQRPDMTFWKDKLIKGIPFWIINLVNILGAQVDILLLSWLVVESEVGLYGAGLGVILALSVLPTTFRLALFPVIARLFVADPAGLRRLYRGSFKYLFMIAAPVSVGLFLTADQVIHLIYGEAFADSTYVLRALCWSMLLLLPGDVDSRLLLASHNQCRAAIHAALGLAVNITLTLLLVPRVGIAGAAWARLASDLAVAALNHAFVQRHLIQVRVISLLWRPMLAAVVMGMVVLSLGASSLGMAIAVGAATYIAIALVFRIITPAEIATWIPPRS